jgi:hypothetical protein
MSNSETQTTNIAALSAPISSDIHHSATRLQHLASTVKSSSCPSNREGLEDSLGGSGLSFLLFASSGWARVGGVCVGTGAFARPRRVSDAALASSLHINHN